MRQSIAPLDLEATWKIRRFVTNPPTYIWHSMWHLDVTVRSFDPVCFPEQDAWTALQTRPPAAQQERVLNVR